MRRNALIKHLKRYGCELFREGAKHSIYWNPTNQRTSSIPRHNEIADKLARKICNDLGVPAPQRPKNANII
jgi:mRNA interferase HicA